MQIDAQRRVGLRQILMIEISMCIAVAGLVVANTFGSLQMWATKTQLDMQMDQTSSGERLQAIEHFDLVGSFTSTTPSTISTTTQLSVPNGRQAAPTTRADFRQPLTFTMRDDGFMVRAANWLGQTMSVDFSPQVEGREGYTVMWQCQSSNLPLALIRQEGLTGKQDALAACRAAKQ